MLRAAPAALLAACAPADAIQVVADDLPGALLAARSDGDEALLVGGAPYGGSGLLLRWSRSGLCRVPGVPDATLWWVHGHSPGDAWAVGEGGVALHLVDGAIERDDVPTDVTLYGVFAAADGTVWAVGGTFAEQPARGEIWRRRAGAWEEVDRAVPAVLFKVWGELVVGDGVAFRLVDGALVEIDVGGERLVTVHGARSGAEVVAVGGRGAAAARRWTGDAFVEHPVPGLPGALNGVWVDDDGAATVVGFDGGVGRLTSRGLEPLEEPLGADLHAVARHGDDLLLLGGDLFAEDGAPGVLLVLGPRLDPQPLRDCDAP